MKEMKRWWKQAESDLEAAEKNIKIKLYYVSAFLSQQAVEKALKALALKEKNKLIKTHNVLRLAKMLNLPSTLLLKTASLEPVYQETRYPDVSSKLPSEEFEKKDAIELLNNALEILEWIKNKLKS